MRPVRPVRPVRSVRVWGEDDPTVPTGVFFRDIEGQALLQSRVPTNQSLNISTSGLIVS